MPGFDGTGPLRFRTDDGWGRGYCVTSLGPHRNQFWLGGSPKYFGGHFLESVWPWGRSWLATLVLRYRTSRMGKSPVWLSFSRTNGILLFTEKLLLLIE